MLRSAEDFDTFKSSFPRRLQALAATQIMLVSSENRGASLSDLIWTELAPYRDKSGGGAVVEGPPLTLPARRAVAELARRLLGSGPDPARRGLARLRR
jgi:two-component sensor histidine kinase